MLQKTHKYTTYPRLRSVRLIVFSCLPKRLTQVYRALYGDAMLVNQHETPIPVAARNQQRHQLFTFAIKMLSFCL